MGIKIESVRSSAHYGNGVVLCPPGGCLKDHKVIAQSAGRYELRTLEIAEQQRLMTAAEAHNREHPDHLTRVIFFSAIPEINYTLNAAVVILYELLPNLIKQLASSLIKEEQERSGRKSGRVRSRNGSNQKRQRKKMYRRSTKQRERQKRNNNGKRIIK